MSLSTLTCLRHRKHGTRETNDMAVTVYNPQKNAWKPLVWNLQRKILPGLKGIQKPGQLQVSLTSRAG